MIISASRRTDIPAFYSDWFMNKIRNGFFYKYNKKMNCYEKISLEHQDVECIVFWTKNAEPITKYLSELKATGYKFYFQYSITPYGKDVEPKINNKRQIMNNFINISNTYGKDAVIWRYDPILLTKKYTIDFHIKSFRQLAKVLSKYTDECIISFVDEISKGNQTIYYEAPNQDEIVTIAKAFSQIAKQYGLKIKTCAEKVDLSKYGIEHAACIDKEKIENITGQFLNVKKDHSQRADCCCVSSFDIGEYFSCLHQCAYCYAGGTNVFQCEHNKSINVIESPLFFGNLDSRLTVKKRKFQSIVSNEQVTLF